MRKKLWILLLPLPLLLPSLVENQYYIHGIVCRICIYALLVASLDLVVGYLGDVSIGHAGFFALGAYAVAALTADPSYNADSSLRFFPQIPFAAALLAGVLLAAFAGFILGFPALRSSGPYLAVITIAYGLIIFTLVNEQEAFTNGTKGISLAPLRVLGVSLNGNRFLYLAYPVMILALAGVRNLARSFWGRAFEAIKYSSVAAESCGVSRSYTKVWAFVLSAGLAGLAGGLFAQLDNYVAPNTFSYNLSVEFLIALILGGVRSVVGNVIGVAIFIILPDLFNRFSDYRLMFFGTLLLVVLFFLPEGIAGVLRRMGARFFRTGREQESAELVRDAAAVDLFAARAAAGAGDALTLEGVRMQFGGLVAVNDLSFSIAPGAVRGLIGPNGSGKSTTVNLLTGLYTPKAGRITSFGEDLRGLRMDQRARRGIARTFQNLQLFSALTVLENVQVGLHGLYRSSLLEVILALPSARREERRARARSYAALEFVGLADQAFVKASDLSYGQARLLEIARALVTGPKLLLLDEPAAGLTGGEIERINGLIRKIKAAGISVLLIEHHMDMVMAISDQVTVLDFGKKIAEGTPREVQSNPLVIEAYLGKHVSSTGAVTP